MTQFIEHSPDNFNTNFLYYFLLYSKKRTFAAKSQGSTFEAINKNDLLNFKVISPPLHVQTQIAEILSSVDASIEKTKVVIEQTKKVKQGLLKELLMRGIDNTKFKDSSSGKIPDGWRIDKLKNIARISGGTTPSKEEARYWDGDILWATPSDVTSISNFCFYITSTKNRITSEALKETGVKLLKPGSVLMTSRATIGEVVINTVAMATNQGFCNFEVDASIDILFFMYWLKTSKRKFIEISSGSTFLEISKQSLKELDIPIPPFYEQKRIAEVLSGVDKKLKEEYLLLEKIQTLKKGLMQDLLTGKVRTTHYSKCMHHE